jgi:hypothetical protein
MPYGPNWRWNGSGWTFVRCDLQGSSAPGINAPYQSAFSGSIDGSADIGIAPINVPGATAPVVPIPDGVIGIPVVDVADEAGCSCQKEAEPRSIWWLVGIGIALWMM